MSPQTSGRIAGLDILRSLAMMMIVAWHFYLYAIGDGLFPANGLGIINYVGSELLVICCSVGVNLFVLISSYFLVEKPFNGSRLLRLWFQVVFYSAGLAILFFFISPENVSGLNLVKSVFPTTFKAYWYFTVYFGLACLAPFLSKTAMALSRKEYQFFLIALVVTCCTFTFVIPLGNTLGAGKGYSLIWFIALFFWGGYFRRFGDGLESKKLSLCFLGILLADLAFCCGKAIHRLYSGAEGFNLEMPANNGFSFLLSIPLFLLFKNRAFKPNFLVRTLIAVAPFTFGVYLFTGNFHIRPLLWNGPVPWSSYVGRPWFIPGAVAVVIVVFFIGVGVDWLRTLLFNVIGVREKCTKLCHWATQKLNRIL